MPRYGPWQEGLVHSLRVTRDRSGIWETPGPWPDEMPYVETTYISARPLGNSANVHGPPSPAGNARYLADRSLLGEAWDCAFSHTRVGSPLNQLWWPESGDPNWAALCAPLSNERAFGQRSPFGQLGATRTYSFSVGGGDRAQWDLQLQTLRLSFDPVQRASGDLAPPQAQWPDGAVDVEFEPGPVTLEGISYHGVDWTPDTVLSSDPLTFIRLWRDGERLDQDPLVSHDPQQLWWPDAPGQNLFASPNNISMWPRIRQVAHGDTVSLDDWLEPIGISDGARSHLQFLWVMPAWMTGQVQGGSEEYAHEGGIVSYPEMRYLLRSRPYRFVFEGQPAVERVFPRDDGLGSSSAPRVRPPSRSRQAGNRAGPGSYS